MLASKWDRIAAAPYPATSESPFAALLRSLAERGLIAPGKRAFGRTSEGDPLPSILAAHGVEVVVSGEPVFNPFHVSREKFDLLVTTGPDDGNFDFEWVTPQ